MDARDGARPGSAGRGSAWRGSSKARIMDRRNAREGLGRARPGVAGLEQGKDHGPAECKRGTWRGTARPGRARRGRSKARTKVRRNGRKGRGGARQGSAWHEQGEDHGPSESMRETGRGRARRGKAGLGVARARQGSWMYVMRGTRPGRARRGKARLEQGMSKARTKGAKARNQTGERQ
jgi:hypothetical protein